MPRRAEIFRPRSKTMPIVIFLAVMFATVGLAFLLENVAAAGTPGRARGSRGKTHRNAAPRRRMSSFSLPEASSRHDPAGDRRHRLDRGARRCRSLPASRFGSPPAQSCSSRCVAWRAPRVHRLAPSARGPDPRHPLHPDPALRASGEPAVPTRAVSLLRRRASRRLGRLAARRPPDAIARGLASRGRCCSSSLAIVGSIVANPERVAADVLGRPERA